MTLNYSKPDARFLETRIHYLGAKGTGRTTSEFPIIYFVLGRIWHVFGQNEQIYRAVILGLFFLGLFALFRTVSDLLTDHVTALFITALMFTSPMLAYYANNFIMNIPALSFVFMGWWAMWNYGRSGRLWFIVIGSAFFLVAGALKATAALSLLVLLFLVVIAPTMLGRELGMNVRPDHRPVAIGLGIACLVCLAAWYGYAAHYNDLNANSIFLVGILPIWELNNAAVMDVVHGIRIHLARDYFRPFLYPIFGMLLGLIAITRRSVPNVMLAILILMIIGTVGISALFFQALRDHDYYSIDQVILIPLLMTCGFMVIAGRYPGFARSAAVQLMMLAILAHCTDFARRRMIDRYSGWMNNEFEQYQHTFATIDPFLQSIGVSRDDKVVCLPDPSPNITLYLMDRKGWTDFDSLTTHPDRIQGPIRMGARYLLIYKPTVTKLPGMAKYLSDPIGHYSNVDVYRISKAMVDTDAK